MLVFKPLPYSEDALAPYISKNTLEFHYGKHHKAYFDNLQKLIIGTQFETSSLDDIILSSYQSDELTPIYNNAAQVFNHDFYWKSMKKDGGNEPSGRIKDEIIKKYKTIDEFKVAFKNAAATQFGSGWAWIVWRKDQNSIDIIKTPNALTPVNLGLTPLLTIDVWEHAYYLDYQNKRVEYIDIFLDKLANWDFANENLKNI